MEISLDTIEYFVSSIVYSRGVNYYKQGRVKLQNVELNGFEAVVRGSRLYHVSVREENQGIHAECDCPYWTNCKHMVAALLAARSYYQKHSEELIREKEYPSWQMFFNQILTESAKRALTSDQKNKSQIVFLIDLSSECWTMIPKRVYLRKNGELGRMTNIGKLVTALQNTEFAPNDPYVIAYLLERHNYPHQTYRHYRRNYEYYAYYGIFESPLEYGCELGELFDLLKQSCVFIADQGMIKERVEFSDYKCRLELRFEECGRQYSVLPKVVFPDRVDSLNTDYKILTKDPVWLLKENCLYRVDGFCNVNFLMPFTKKELFITIPKNQFSQFVEQFLPKLDLNIRLPEKCHFHALGEITKKRIYLSEGTRQLEVYPSFFYRDVEVNFYEKESTFYKKGKDEFTFFKVQRDFESENQVCERLLKTGLKELAEGGMAVRDSKALNWMFSQIPTLVQEGFEVYGRDKLKKYKARVGLPRVDVSVTSGIDWFDLNVKIDFEGVLLSIKEIRRAILQKQSYVKLVDGSFAMLPEDWLRKFQHLFSFGNVKDQRVRVSRFHVSLIDLFFEEASSKKMDDTYRRSLTRLKSFQGIKNKPVPSELRSILRSYQKAGYNWLYFLKEFSFGGCLADDMGLGKTLQTLSLILNEKKSGNKIPSLIVCPTSVVFNWENEVQKFTPNLRVLKHVGLDRGNNPEIFKKYDIVLTSYGIMRRDIVFLKDFQFYYVILDESQKIKNPVSQTSKAVRLLQANYRLVLTGTPIENNTLELWSQFAFLNPGFLGSLNSFKHGFTIPIDKKKETDTAQILKKLIYPFVLRRTKEAVAKELPPKVEQVYYCHMNPLQEKLYNQWRDYYRALILNKIDDIGIEKSKMFVLQGLTKLRQIACHPNLVDKRVGKDSGKFESLKEILEDILAEKHKVLIFSQFVRMLKLVRKYIDNLEIFYEYLDGHTRNREACVRRFQKDEDVRIFLISLRAGGTGLNLTAADYVIHYDPWWNPAVEIQATDRTHRIGQDKRVFVYKLITKNSVEEKILELQERKRDLVSNLITTDSSFFKQLTREDVEVLFGG